MGEGDVVAGPLGLRCSHTGAVQQGFIPLSGGRINACQATTIQGIQQEAARE